MFFYLTGTQPQKPQRLSTSHGLHSAPRTPKSWGVNLIKNFSPSLMQLLNKLERLSPLIFSGWSKSGAYPSEAGWLRLARDKHSSLFYGISITTLSTTIKKWHSASQTYILCVLCFVSQLNTLRWVSLCWWPLCRVSQRIFHIGDFFLQLDTRIGSKLKVEENFKKEVLR